MKQTDTRRQSVNWNGPVRAILLLALAMPFFGGPLPSSRTHSSPQAHPALLEIAAERPDALVSVIVQKAAKNSAPEAMITRLGGVVTQDLSIINAFAAEMSAQAAVELSKSRQVRWVSPNAPVNESSGPISFTTWAIEQGTEARNNFTNPEAMFDTSQGPNGTFGRGSEDAEAAFAGFTAEKTPGNAITRIEVALQTYVVGELRDNDTPKLKIYINGLRVTDLRLQRSSFSSHVGAANAGMVYVDVTQNRRWQWGDFDNGLEVVIEQKDVKRDVTFYYDAVGLRVTSASGADTTGGTAPTSLASTTFDPNRLLAVYPKVVHASDLWNGTGGGPSLQGQGVSVAVVDSGVYKTRDLNGRVIGNSNFNNQYHRSVDAYGHGTFVAGIIAGDGRQSNGGYVGIAPKTNIINVRVSDDNGMSTESDVVRSLQWIHENKSRYNIRVVNISSNSSLAQSYHTSPINAAVEVLWFNGIVVVVSAGNNGTGNLYPPANDPFVITVGATNDRGTTTLTDDTVASFSAFGLTEAGVSKPDLVAPGTNIVSLLPKHRDLTISSQHSSNRVNADYFRMSGTSMAAPMVSGAVALLLQDEPNLTPDQVKYRLKATAVRDPLLWPGYDLVSAGAGYLDIYAAVYGTTTQNANTGSQASQLLWTGNDPVLWNSVNWNSVNWNSVNWNSVNWNSVNWNSVNWTSDYWDE